MFQKTMPPRNDDGAVPSFVVDDDLNKLSDPPLPPVAFDPPSGGLTPPAFRTALIARASAEEAVRKEKEAAEAAEAAALASGLDAESAAAAGAAAAFAER